MILKYGHCLTRSKVKPADHILKLLHLFLWIFMEILVTWMSSLPQGTSGLSDYGVLKDFISIFCIINMGT